MGQNPRAGVDVRVQYESGRHRGVEARLEVGGDSDTRRVLVKDGYVDARGFAGFADGDAVRFGRGKKILGWEYEDNRRERLTLQRSIVYRFLESTSLVGRDLFIGARLRGFRGNVRCDDVGNVATVLSLQWTTLVGPVGACWALLQREHHGAVTWATACGVKVNGGHHRGVVEVFTGVDPYQSELATVYGDGDTVHFAAAKAEYGRVLGRVTVYLQGAVVLPDLSAHPRTNFQGLFGTRFALMEALRLACEMDVVSNDSVALGTSRIWGAPTFRVEIRYFFS